MIETEELYNEYYYELIGWCSLMTQNRTLAEDLVQEAFLRALINAELIQNLQPRQQKAWLYRTVKNLYLDKVRHTAFETITDDVLSETEVSEKYTDIDNQQLIDTLPDEERFLFIMRYIQGYNATELGTLFGLPSGTVRSRLSSARKRLRSALKEIYNSKIEKEGN